MTPTPWWLTRAAALLEPQALGPLSLEALWHLRERLEFIHHNVDPADLAIDVERRPYAAAVWAELVGRTDAVDQALKQSLSSLARRMQGGDWGPAAFRAHWEMLGYQRRVERGGTPADDFLDAMFDLSRLEREDRRPPSSTLNLSSRAERVSDFLQATSPGEADLVFDLGSGGGKVALTVAASTDCQVHGVEMVKPWVEDSRWAAAYFGMTRARFSEADVRDVDLSRGTIFYLFHPFFGEVARDVAAILAQHARHADLRIYLAGPRLGFAEHFLDQVERGALSIMGRRGEFDEVVLLRSAGASKVDQRLA